MAEGEIYPARDHRNSALLASRLALALAACGQTVAVVEASAGGRVSSALTAIPGSSAWFLGAVIAYSARAKEVWLGLGPEAMRATGTVSAEAALALAHAARAALGANWGAAETGIAGPQTGRRSTKPVGLAYVAVVGGAENDPPREFVAEVQTGLGDREGNQSAFAAALLDLLLESAGRTEAESRG